MICYLIAAAAVLAAVYFAVRSFLLKRSLRNASEELRRITRSLEENRVLKLETADRDLEEFVGEVNRTLSAIRREKNAFSRREQEFRQQIENISHDLRTPLTSILGYLKLMDTENMPADEKESLDTVRRKAEALSRLIGQFYEYSRVASEDYQPELAEMDLCRLLRETVLDSWKEIEGRRLEFSFHIPERPVVIRGNENSAERIIRNLLQNAERYAEHCLEISLKEEAGRVILMEVFIALRLFCWLFLLTLLPLAYVRITTAFLYATEKSALSYLLVYAEPVLIFILLLILPRIPAFGFVGVWLSVPAAQLLTWCVAVFVKHRVDAAYRPASSGRNANPLLGESRRSVAGVDRPLACGELLPFHGLVPLPVSGAGSHRSHGRIQKAVIPPALAPPGGDGPPPEAEAQTERSMFSRRIGRARFQLRVM